MDMVLDSCWIMLFPLVSEFSRVLQQIPKPVVPLFWNLGKTKKNTLFSSQQQHHHHIIIKHSTTCVLFQTKKKKKKKKKREWEKIEKKKGIWDDNDGWDGMPWDWENGELTHIFELDQTQLPHICNCVVCRLRWYDQLYQHHLLRPKQIHGFGGCHLRHHPLLLLLLLLLLSLW